MNVLWITNTVFPEARKMLGNTETFKDSGGWMLALANELTKREGIRITVLTVDSLVKELTQLQGENISYFLLPLGRGENAYISYMKAVNDLVKPNVVHIHGTEFPYGLYYIRACGSEKVVVSIQGVISVIARYYTAGLKDMDIIKAVTFRDLMRHSIYGEKRIYQKRGELEIKTISSISHVIGRTTFDRAHALSINPSLNYHFCNESLREEFYTGRWNYNSCVPHTIFLSQSSYPIKGLHQVLKAMPLILRNYPDTMIRVAGVDITKTSTIKERIRLSGYGHLLRKLICSKGLKGKITFTGALDAVGMKNEYLRANLFMCPSSIENSPNSLGEAQILGVPCLAAYAGGIPDMIPNTRCGILYRFDDIELLAAKVCDIFESSIEVNNSEMIALAQSRHNRCHNTDNMLSIYREISK